MVFDDSGCSRKNVVQERMFHVEHQQRKSVSEKHKTEKEKIVVI